MKIQFPAQVGVALLTLLAPIAWGTTYLTITELLPPDRPLSIAAIRVLPAGVLLVGIGVLRGAWRPTGQRWFHLAILATFNLALFFPLLIAAIQRLPGGIVASVGGLQPLLVIALARVVSGTKMRRIDIAIGFVAAIGVSLVVIRPGAELSPIGILLAVAAVVSFSIGIVLTKSFPAPQNRLAATGWQLLIGAVVLVPLAVLIEGAPTQPSPMNVLGFAYLSLIATGVAFALWFNGINRLPISAPPLLALAAPITGAALGWIVLDESLSTLQLLGFVITLGAISYGAAFASRPNPMAAEHREVNGGQIPSRLR